MTIIIHINKYITTNNNDNHQIDAATTTTTATTAVAAATTTTTTAAAATTTTTNHNDNNTNALGLPGLGATRLDPIPVIVFYNYYSALSNISTYNTRTTPSLLTAS